MSDRFKFRVWDIEEWTYLKCKYSKSAGYYKYTYGKHDVWQDIGYFIEGNPKYYIVEQCTGLKDKNGNLIYEGDVVSGRYFNPYHPKTPNPKIKGTIKFIQDRMTWIIEDGDCGYDLEDCMPTKEYFKIIGNIHENKGE